MRLTSILALITLICCVALVAAADAAAQTAPLAGTSRVYMPLIVGTRPLQTPEQEAMASQVLTLINAERARAGCGPVSRDYKLTTAAQGHSQDMATNNFFSHSGSNGSTLVSRISAAAYTYRAAGENIAAGYTTAQAVVDGWMGSEGHRDNILNCTFVHTGIGYVDQSGSPYVHYWTQVFAAPR